MCTRVFGPTVPAGAFFSKRLPDHPFTGSSFPSPPEICHHRFQCRTVTRCIGAVFHPGPIPMPRPFAALPVMLVFVAPDAADLPAAQDYVEIVLRPAGRRPRKFGPLQDERISGPRDTLERAQELRRDLVGKSMEVRGGALASRSCSHGHLTVSPPSGTARHGSISRRIADARPVRYIYRTKRSAILTFNHILMQRRSGGRVIVGRPGRASYG